MSSKEKADTITITNDDFAENSSTTGRVSVGGSVVSEHTSNDTADWFAVSLVAGKEYALAFRAHAAD